MSGEYREGGPRDLSLSPWIEDGVLAMGIDPGARNTGVSVVRGEIPVYSATIVRNGDEDHIAYALRVLDTTKKVWEEYGPGVVGIENVSKPKGFSRSSKGASPINPGSLIMTGVVLGAVISFFRDDKGMVMVHPRGNGSRNLTQYPDSLKGRRPNNLPGESNGAGRGHEQSAFDIALKAVGLI